MSRLLRLAFAIFVLSLGMEGVDRALLLRSMSERTPPALPALTAELHASPVLPPPPPPPPPPMPIDPSDFP